MNKDRLQFSSPELKNYLIVNNIKNSSSLLLLLFLKGVTKFRYSGRTIEQSTNFTILPCRKVTKAEQKKLLKKVNTLSSKKTILFENNNFYNQILEEFIECFKYIEQKNGIGAFVHLYRILERISYATPLIYAKSTNDFLKTYDSLKRFFVAIDYNAGELAFFKNSLPMILDDVELGFTHNFIFNNTTEKWFIQYYKGHDSTDNGTTTQYNLTAKEIIELIISLRNGFFHSLSGKPHISLSEITNPNNTLLKNIKKYINIISYILTSIIEKYVIQ